MPLLITRGTTPEITIHIPSEIELGTATEIWVTIRQLQLEITKTLVDGGVVVDQSDLLVELSQGDTLRLKPGTEAGIQIRILLDDDIALASQIEPIIVKDIVKDGEIHGS